MSATNAFHSTALLALASVCIGAQTPAPQNPPPTNPVIKPAGPSPFVLDLEAAASGNPIVLSRPDKGLITLNLIYSGATAANAQVETTAFTADTGAGSIDVDILKNCGDSTSKLPQLVLPSVQPNTIVPVCLYVHPLPATAKYTGRLIITVPGATTAKAITWIQSPTPQGTLLLDRTTVSQTISRSWWPPTAADGAQMQCSVTLHEKTGSIALQGVSVRLEQVSSSPDSGFDLKKNVTFDLNGKTPVDLDQFPPADGDAASRTIAAGGQSVVKMTLHDLMPGDYDAVLHFTANNSAADDAQKFEIKVHVRDSVAWAVGWLIVALIISFIGTKVLTSLRRRASLLQQISALQPQWLSSLLPIPPVVWLRAVLHQAKRLSKHFWLTSPDLIEASVNSAKSMEGVLDGVHQLRQQLELALHPLVFRRAVIAFDRVVSQLGTSPLTDTEVQTVNAQIAAFKDWLADDKFAAVFWKDIQPALQALQNELAAGNIPDVPGAADLIGALRTALGAALTAPPTTRPNLEFAYLQYAKLRILWDQRAEDLEQLIQLAQNDIDEFFKRADDRLWQRIRTAPLTIRMPNVNDPSGLEAYQVLQFSIETTNPEIDRSYLFRHKIEYRWTFEQTPTKQFLEKHGLRRNPHKIQLHPVSLGPTVVQYFPRAGATHVSVKLLYGNEVKEVPAAAGPVINPSSDFQPYNILAGTEIASWLIAAITAIATGLTMFYYKGTSWGTYQDYLTLLLWGIGVDQGKNFLQALQFYSPSTTTPPPAAH